MAALNVFTGPDSLKDFYNPDLQPPVPLVEIPRKLNPFYDDGVRIYAKMMSALPANNVKALPALNMLQKEVRPETRTIIEYSSGSTVISMSIIARVLFGIDDTRAFLSNKTSWAKLQLMRFFGLNIRLFGGPSQPEPLDRRGGIWQAKRLGRESDDITNPDQYSNDLNWQAHIRWTGPQLMRQLPHINVFCAGMGTSGTMTGIGTYLKQIKPSVVRVGVCTKAGDRVPGPRSFALLSPVEFPWRDAVDIVEEVGSSDSYRLSLSLSREGLICGPSSGFNLQGLYNFIERRKAAGTLSELAGVDNQIHCVFICCDLPYQYLDDYFVKLGEEAFHPLVNDNLLSVDLHRYDEAWELSLPTALKQIYGTTSHLTKIITSKPDTPPSTPPEIPSDSESDSPISSSAPLPLPKSIIIDLRSPADFNAHHFPGAINRPLISLERGQTSPFEEPKILEEQWRELEDVFCKGGEAVGELVGRDVLVVCYGGDTARVASSVLRAKEVSAFSLQFGMDSL